MGAPDLSGGMEYPPIEIGGSGAYLGNIFNVGDKIAIFNDLEIPICLQFTVN